MNSYLKSQLFLSAFVLSICSPLSALADDDSVQQGLGEAKVLFEQRSAVNPKPIEDALAKLATLEGQAEDSDINYDVLILTSRALYWKGQHVNSNDERLSLHEKGQEKADAAKVINNGYAEGYYYAGINLARWGEAKGVLASLSRKSELIKYMEETMNHITRDDLAGETVDGYGPARVFGKMYFMLPGIFGGSRSESLKHLKTAVANAKNFPLNVVYYADVLKAGNSSEKVEAKKLLDELLASNPQAYNPSRVPENIDEFEEAKKLRAEMN